MAIPPMLDAPCGVGGAEILLDWGARTQRARAQAAPRHAGLGRKRPGALLRGLRSRDGDHRVVAAALNDLQS